MEHHEVEIIADDEREQACEALIHLLAGAKTMIALSEGKGVRAKKQTTLVIPLELGDGITVWISKEYKPEVKH